MTCGFSRRRKSRTARASGSESGRGLTHNVPDLDGEPVPGVQHKYAETCLVFPSVGQTCHAFCTYCFRWAQFVGRRDLKFATDRDMTFLRYLREHHEVSDVLLTGGDPLVMPTTVLARYIEPLLAPGFEHIRTIRLGTKALTYWPHRFVTDDDADELMRLLERVVAAGNLGGRASAAIPNAPSSAAHRRRTATASAWRSPARSRTPREAASRSRSPAPARGCASCCGARSEVD